MVGIHNSTRGRKVRPYIIPKYKIRNRISRLKRHGIGWDSNPTRRGLQSHRTEITTETGVSTNCIILRLTPQLMILVDVS